MRLMTKQLTALILGCLTSVAIAQTAPQAPQPSTDEKVEMYRINLQIADKMQEAQKKFMEDTKDLQDKRKALIAVIEKEHPGYKWQDDQSGGTLVEIPKPPAPAAKQPDKK